MDQEPFQHALARIEAAISRIEARTLVASPIADPELRLLAERHARLRGQAGEALARLDRLIERTGAAG